MKFAYSLIALVVYALLMNYIFNHLDAWIAIILSVIGGLILVRIFQKLINKHLNDQ